MGRLTTHVLDTAGGCPAAGVVVELYAVDAAGVRALVTRTTTNADGRTDEPLLAGDAFELGLYEIEFAIGEYFRRTGLVKAGPSFLDMVPVRFAINDSAAHYHVPLLASPFAYSTYRGS